jgi:hypothetical protein
MKRFYLVSLLCFFTFCDVSIAHGQIYLSYFVGGCTMLNGSKSFKDWRNEYNSVNAEVLDKKMSAFRPGFGYTLAGNMIISTNDKLAYYFSFRYTSGFSKALATFKEGTQREMKLLKQSYHIPVGLGVFSAEGKRFYKGFFYSIPVGISDYQLEASFIYKDGTKSIGYDKSLNGVFRNLDPKIGLDMTFVLRYNRFGVMMNLTYMGTMLPSKRDESALEDRGSIAAFGTYRRLDIADGYVNAKFRELMFNINLSWNLSKEK